MYARIAAVQYMELRHISQRCRVHKSEICVHTRDDGGSRSGSGMRAIFTLFTVFATCKLNGASFYNALCNSTGDG